MAPDHTGAILFFCGFPHVLLLQRMLGRLCAGSAFAIAANRGVARAPWGSSLSLEQQTGLAGLRVRHTLSDKNGRRRAEKRKRVPSATTRTAPVSFKEGGLLAGIPPDNPLRATHAVATVVAQVTVAIPHRDGTAVVATRCVGLEAGELFGPIGQTNSRLDFHGDAGPLQLVGVDGRRSTCQRQVLAAAVLAGTVGLGAVMACPLWPLVRGQPRWPARRR